jgi:3-oxoacyl-[acyl-carrier-protein] synthase III
MPEAVLAPFWLAPPQPAVARTAAVLSVATELPQQRLTSAEIASKLGIEEQWILSRTGIRERRQARPDERLSDFAARAGARALERAGVQAADLDLVLVATMSQDELTPNTAPIVAHALGADKAGAIDVGAACTAFLSGLSLGAAQIEAGRAERVLLIGADFIT